MNGANFLTTISPQLRAHRDPLCDRGTTSRTTSRTSRDVPFVRGRAALAEAHSASSSRAGSGLKVWDCYRPLSVQKVFWSLVPDERYVAESEPRARATTAAPRSTSRSSTSAGASSRCRRRSTISPSARIAISPAARHARRNRQLLEEVDDPSGFVGLPTEWWHFDLSGWEKYDLLDVPLK